jgi:Ser/Thr protein kinase RdoA (MazF antagonist)
VTDEALVRAALQRYGVSARRVRPLAAQVDRIDAVDGRRFALRCRPQGDRAFGNIPLELAWTDALRRETEIRPPEAVAGLDGEAVQDVASTPGAGRHDCVLFTWIPGPALSERLTLENVRRLGALAARLHAHAAGFGPPQGVARRTLDGLLRPGEREVLFAYDHPAFLPPPRRALFERVAARWRATVDDLFRDPAGRRVIHADLHHENVILHRGRLRPLDFYEVIWGYPLQDIALTFFDFRYYTDARSPGYDALRRAFASGYAAHLPWPEESPGQIDILVAGRRLRQANWVLWRETAPFAEEASAVPDPARIVPYFERLEGEFRALLDG